MRTYQPMNLRAMLTAADIAQELQKVQTFLRTLKLDNKNPLSGPPPVAGPVNLDDYFFLPGRSGGQIGHGDTVDGGQLTLASTRAATKGFIYFGNAHASAYDEVNSRLGVNIAIPTATVHAVGGAAAGTVYKTVEHLFYSIAVDPVVDEITDLTDVPARSLTHDGDSTYIAPSGGGGPGQWQRFENLTGCPSTGVTLHIVARKTVVTDHAIDWEITWGTNFVTQGTCTLTTSYQEFTYTLTDPEILEMSSDLADVRILLKFVPVLPTPVADSMRITAVWLTWNPSGAGGPVARWDANPNQNSFDSNTEWRSWTGDTLLSTTVGGRFTIEANGSMRVVPNAGVDRLFTSNATGDMSLVAVGGDLTLSSGIWTIANDAVTFARMQNVTGPTLLGRITGTSGDVSALTPTQATALLDLFTSSLKGLTPASGGGSTNYLRADGTWAVPPGTAGGVSDGDKGDITVAGGGTIWSIDTSAVTFTNIQIMNTNRFLGRNTAGSGHPEEMTVTTATAMLNLFSSTLKGLVPLSGGGTTNFLRADGTWAAPPGGGGLTVHDHSGATLGGDTLGAAADKINLLGQFGLNVVAASTPFPVLMDLKGTNITDVPLGIRRFGSTAVGPQWAVYDQTGGIVAQCYVDASDYCNIEVGNITYGGSIGLSGMGFFGYFFPPPGGLSSTRYWTFTDEDGYVLLDYGIQDVGNKALQVTNTLRSSTQASGVSFVDFTTSSKRLRMILSSASGNNVFNIVSTSARIWSFQNVTGKIPVVGDDPTPVATGALGVVDVTAQAAAIAAVNLTNGGLAGFYNVQYDLEVTTLQAGAGTVEIQINYTDHIGATTQVGAPAPLTLQALGRQRGSFQVWLDSGELAYQTNVVTQALARYALHLRVTYLG